MSKPTSYAKRFLWKSVFQRKRIKIYKLNVQTVEKEFY